MYLSAEGRTVVLPSKQFYHLIDHPIRDWNTAQFGKGLWFDNAAFKDPAVMWIVETGLAATVKFTFRKKEDATMFALKWL
jgi:hypothetical protein